MKIKNICCIGAGYVGGPTMAVIAEKCPSINVTCVDIDADKINAWNSENYENIPVKEPGLANILMKVRGKNLFFSSDIKKNIENSEMIFLAVNTPTKTKGKGKGYAADLKYIVASTKQILKYSKSNKIVIEKSTLPVRTAEKIEEILSNNKKKLKFTVLSNPEFLAEGTAIQDLYKSDRVLIGGRNDKDGKLGVQLLKQIYLNWIPEKKIITTRLWSAELSKLASNAMLAQRISSINALSALCKTTEADIDEVSQVIGMDVRIGKKFLKVSPGFGGSCFKKDILNLVYLCKSFGLNEVAEYWYQVVKINEYQKNRVYNIAKDILKKEKINDIIILGWAFKKNTNDSRESASIHIAYKLLKEGIRIHVYDPLIEENKIILDLENFDKTAEVQLDNCKRFISQLNVYNSIKEIITKSNVCIILTECDEFKNFNWKTISKPFHIFDSRNYLSKNVISNKLINYIKF